MIEDDEEYMDMQDELMDRFGDIPKPVENLLKVAALKAMAHKAYVTEVSINKQEARLTMFQRAKLDVAKIPEIVAEYKGDLKFQAGQEAPYFLYRDQRNKNKDCMAMMEKTKELLKKLDDIVEK